MTRTPIDFEDIRPGDLIRSEATNGTTLGENLLAAEWRATSETWAKAPSGHVNFYLIDRPAPPVDLPKTPTLGWLTTKAGGVLVGTWETYTPVVFGDEKREYALSRERDIPVDRVTTFVPATAVPSEALDRLRAERVVHTNGINGRAIATFLAAVDEANES